MYWAYKAWDDPTGNPAAEGLFASDGDLSSLKAPKADVLIRAYPQAVAGTPVSVSWDGAAKVMDLRYRPTGSGVTDVFVPARHYGRGYDAVVTGGRVVSARGARHLLVRASGAGEVHVVVRPAAAGGGAGVGGGAPGAPGRLRTLPTTGLSAGLGAVAGLLMLLGLMTRRRAKVVAQ
jgi:hypothetical protein